MPLSPSSVSWKSRRLNTQSGCFFSWLPAINENLGQSLVESHEFSNFIFSWCSNAPGLHCGNCVFILTSHFSFSSKVSPYDGCVGQDVHALLYAPFYIIIFVKLHNYEVLIFIY